jgi:hypothetical protein
VSLTQNSNLANQGIFEACVRFASEICVTFVRRPKIRILQWINYLVPELFNEYGLNEYGLDA